MKDYTAQLKDMADDISESNIDNTSLSELRNLRSSLKSAINILDDVQENYSRELISDANTMALHLSDLSDDVDPKKFIQRHSSALAPLARYMGGTEWAETKLAKLIKVAKK